MPRKDVVIRGAGILVVAGVLAGGGSYVVGGGGEAAAANAWVNTSAQTCTRSSTPITFEQAQTNGWLCGTFDAAWDAMSAGDTARVKPGTYSTQCITGDKASDTKIIGDGDGPEDVIVQNTGVECFAVFSGASAVGVGGDNFWLENVTLDSQTQMQIGSAARLWNFGECLPSCNGDNATFVNVNSKGRLPAFKVEADGFEWHGGTRGETGYVMDPPLCSGGGQPIDLSGDNIVIDGVRFNPVLIESGGCDPHVENIRIEGALNNITIKNNYFVAGSDVGSGHIYHPSPNSATNVKIVNNYFGDTNGSYWCQCFNGTGWVIAYNTFEDEPASFTADASVLTWVGNLGANGSAPGCTGTRTKNVWGGSGSCGTDTFVGATDIGVNETTGELESGSPAIDAAETPGASDYCTDSAYVNSLDRGGQTRPNGSVCDAGADER